jgi:GAF domain-containing protein
VPSSVHTQVLLRAARILGSKHTLRSYLGVSERCLDAWLEGSERSPDHVFLRAVDLISWNGVPRRASELAARLRAAILERADPTARRCDLSAREFAATDFPPADAALIVDSALSAALNDTDAARGNVQLACPEGLRIVSQIGFAPPFLQFFATVRHDTPASCGRARERATRVVIPDVLADPIFAGTPAAAVMASAGALACQSTPLVARSGEVIGMLSTHYDKPHQPSPGELEAIDLVARHTSELLAP